MGLKELAEQLKSGTITLAEWETQMRQYLRSEYTTAMILSKGGRNNITQADWGYLGSELKKQYQYLGNFAKDIMTKPEAWLNGRLDNRMNLYRESAYSALENFDRREHVLNGYTEERRVLGEADHCEGCLAQASMGWQPIGTLDPIGAEECATNCKCEFEYRKDTDMLFAPAQNTDMLFAPAETGQ